MIGFAEVEIISEKTEDGRKGRERLKLFSLFALVGQFGLSLVCPMILCVAFCYFLFSRGVIGAWVFIPGFILGVGASFMTAYKFYLYAIGGDKKEKRGKKKDRGICFNNHV